MEKLTFYVYQLGDQTLYGAVGDIGGNKFFVDGPGDKAFEATVMDVKVDVLPLPRLAHNMVRIYTQENKGHRVGDVSIRTIDSNLILLGDPQLSSPLELRVVDIAGLKAIANEFYGKIGMDRSI